MSDDVASRYKPFADPLGFALLYGALVFALFGVWSVSRAAQAVWLPSLVAAAAAALAGARWLLPSRD